MHVEVSVALNFVISYLYNKLPRRRVDCFGEELEKLLKAKFAGHWYPEKPYKGSAFRCIRATGEQMDPIMELASTASGLDIEEVKDYLPKDLSIWIDPYEVSYRIGEKGVAKVLHSEKQAQQQQQQQPQVAPRIEDDTSSDSSIDHEVMQTAASHHGFNPEAQSFKPIDSLSSSLSSMSLSAGSSPSGWGPPSTSPILMAPVQQHAAAAAAASASTSPIHLFSRQPSNATFTAATFAQTKFGSTKLKSQAKRPSRLSPTELGAYLKQRPVPGAPWIGPAGALPPQQQHSPLSPRDIHQELLEQQQQRILLIQQQQLQQQIHQQMQQLQQQQQQRPLAPTPAPPQLSPLPKGPPHLSAAPGGPTSTTPSSAGSNPWSTSDLGSPSSSSSSGLQLTDLYPTAADLLAAGHRASSPPLPSPDALLDVNWSSLAAGYPNLQHLLVAN